MSVRRTTLRFLWSASIFLALVFLFFVLLLRVQIRTLREQVDDQLWHAAQTISAILPDDFFERATHPGAISREEDTRNIEQLTDFANRLGLTYLYTLYFEGDQLYITSSSASEEELASQTEVRYFVPYPEGVSFARQALAEKAPVFNSYKDRWGHFRHVYIPQRTAGGQAYILAADYQTDHIHDLMMRSIFPYLLLTLGFSFCSALLFIYTIRAVRKEDVARLQKLNRQLEAEVAAAVEAKASLMTSESRWRTTLNSIGDAVISTDTKGIVRTMNPVAERLTG